MSASEIWSEINSLGLIKKFGKTPISSLQYQLQKASIGGDYNYRYKNPIFKINNTTPQTFELIKNDFSLDSDLDKINKDLTTTNPFQQAICVLGDSGAGKSYSIEKILKAEGHEYDFIIPTAATTGLLAQYSPRKKEYVPSRLSKMIINAHNNPTKLYTAVFDECHKSNVIEMINDELLQAISIRRNNKIRFISLDSDTAEQVFDGTDIEIGRNIEIPDNLGFIFISSNPRVIGGNPDFFNRVDLVQITEDNRNDFNSSDDLLEKSLKDRKDKESLIVSLKTKPNI
jgi:hypothetical protein